MVERNRKVEKQKVKRSPLRGDASMVDVGNSIITVALLYPEVLPEIDLMSEYFPLAWQQEVWRKIKALYDARNKVDVVLVAEALARDGIPPPTSSWISDLAKVMKECPSSDKTVHGYVESLNQWQRRSRCYEIGHELCQKSVDGEDGSDDAIRSLMAMSTSVRTLDGPMSESIGEAAEFLDSRANARDGVHGVPYGIKGLDNLLAGMEKTHLIVLAARPAMGKTAAALCFCANNRDRPIGFISTEQPRREMINRLVSIHGRVDSHNIRKGKLSNDEWAQVTKAYQDISTWPLYMNDRPAPHLTDVIRQARKWKQRYGIELLVVDYLQRITVPGVKRHEEVSESARGMKDIARELEIPVLALSQINRSVESRPNKRPVLSDLRESGDIEQEADIIATIYRDEVYNDDESGRNKGVVEFGIPKNRHGPVGRTFCHFEARYLRFESITVEQQVEREFLETQLQRSSDNGSAAGYRSDG